MAKKDKKDTAHGLSPEQGPHDAGEREQRDTDVPGVFGVGIALVCLIGGSMLLIHLMIAALGGSPLGKYTEPAQYGDFKQAADDPRYQNLPAQQRRVLAAMEASLLTTYSWVERASGVVRIPVDRAIDLVAERGLPAAQATTATTPTTR